MIIIKNKGITEGVLIGSPSDKPTQVRLQGMVHEGP